MLNPRHNGDDGDLNLNFHRTYDEDLLHSHGSNNDDEFSSSDYCEAVHIVLSPAGHGIGISDIEARVRVHQRCTEVKVKRR